MEKKLLFVLTLLLAWIPIQAQVVLYTEGFETDGEGTRYTSNHYNDGLCNFWERSTVTPLNTCFNLPTLFSNYQGSFFWGSEDVTNGGVNPAGRWTSSSINISGYATLTFSLFFATTNGGFLRWENADSVNLQASIDGGPFRTVGRFVGKDPGGGGDLVIDANLNGIGDVGETTIASVSNFTQRSFSIPGSGSTLQVRVDADFNGGSEELGWDLAEVRGTLVPCTPPSATCPGTQTLPLNSSCQATLPDYRSLVTAVGGTCGPMTIVQSSPAIGSTQSGTGAITVTMFAQNTALQGSTNTCTFTVNKVDNTLPAITCPANISVSASVGTCAATVTYTAPTGTDNCTGPTTTRTAGLASGASYPVGVTTNIFRVTDGAGNTATCAFTVTVIDNQLPAITCPTNQTANTSPGICTASVTYTTPVGTDNCTGVTTTQTAGLASGSAFPAGLTTNTFRATDGAGNTASCAFTITVIDNQAPTIVCPGNVTAANDPNQCGLGLIYLSPLLGDNCTLPTIVQTAGLASGATFPIGTTTNAFTATDASGNTASCSFTVNINDTESPTITCPSNIVASTAANSCDAVVNFATPVGVDNCPGPQVAISSGLPSGSVFTLGMTTQTFEVTDASNNTATCSFTITIVDSVAPTANCQNITVYLDANGLFSITIQAIENGSTDNCALSNLFLDVFSFDCSGLGSQNVVLTANDIAGNSSTCAATVLVVDSISPVAICQPFTLYLDAQGNASLLTSDIDGGSMDNCGVSTQSASPDVFTSANIGANAVVLTVTDTGGNTSTCTTTVTVLDTLVAIDEPLRSQILFSASPNPAQDRLQVQVECKVCVLGDEITLQLWSMHGQLLRVLPVTGQQQKQLIDLDLSGIAAGNYVLNLRHNGRTLTCKVVKL